MPSINRVTLLGHLGRDPELKYTQNGKPVCNASIATEKSWKQDDEWKKKTTWHRIVAWRKLAEALGQATKGDLVFVEGQLTQRSWENKEGVKQYVTEILAGVVVLMGKGHGKPTEGDVNESPPPGTDDDVPF
jgi:single-strand DNA-binding protein